MYVKPYTFVFWLFFLSFQSGRTAYEMAVSLEKRVSKFIIEVNF